MRIKPYRILGVFLSNSIEMKALKLFPKHCGIWEGTYTRISADGDLVDKWKCRLTIRMLPNRRYHQVNQYFWDDGFEECLDFGICKFNDEGELIFENPRLSGKAWESGRSIVLIWDYKHRPGLTLFEQIDLIGNDDHRIRVWKWSEGDTFNGITMINERKIGGQEDIDPAFWERLPDIRTNGKASRSDS